MENEHEVKETITIDIFYPNHPPRKESALFAKTKKHMIKDLDTPCYVCGSKEQREVHHFHAEYADAEAVNWDKMKVLHPDFDWSKFTKAEDFIDSQYNMMILCKKHHTGKDHGIHFLPYPIWITQVIKRDDFVFSPDEEKK